MITIRSFDIEKFLKEEAEQRPHYNFEEDDLGFTVKHSHNPKLYSRYFVIGELLYHKYYDHYKDKIQIDNVIKNVFQTKSIFDDFVANIVLQQRKANEKNQFVYNSNPYKKLVAMALCKRFMPLWRTLRAKLPPDRVAFDRRCFHVLGPKRSNYIPANQLWSNFKNAKEYVRKDIMKYSWALKVFTEYDLPDWRRQLLGIFGDEKIPKIANQTIDNWKGSVTDIRWKDIPWSSFNQPIGKLELRFISAIQSQYNHDMRQCYVAVTSKQIKKAFRLAKRAEGSGVYGTLRGRNALINFARWLADFRQPYNGDLIGLTKRCIDWHRDIALNRASAYTKQFAPETALAKPPIEFTPDDNIKLLLTVGELKQESINMHHCVGSYADKAIRGDCYIFHAEHKGERATIEVSPVGQIVQSHGPCNKRNKACEFAESSLSGWLSQLRKVSSNAQSND